MPLHPHLPRSAHEGKGHRCHDLTSVRTRRRDLYAHYRKARIMFNKLLVPLDGTVEAAAALPAATTLAHATGASITLVRVTANSGDDPAEARVGDLIAEDEVRAAAEDLARGGLLVDSLVRAGPVPESI